LKPERWVSLLVQEEKYYRVKRQDNNYCVGLLRAYLEQNYLLIFQKCILLFKRAFSSDGGGTNQTDIKKGRKLSIDKLAE
jgi:hypothetical protein